MAKSKEHDQIVTTKNGVTQARIVNTVVKDGKLVPDDTAPENGVKN